MQVCAIFNDNEITFTGSQTIGGYDRPTVPEEHFTPYGFIVADCAIGTAIEVLSTKKVDLSSLMTHRFLVFRPEGYYEYKVASEHTRSLRIPGRWPSTQQITFSPYRDSDGIALFDYLASLPGDPYELKVRNTTDVLKWLKKRYNVPGFFKTYLWQELFDQLSELHPELLPLPLVSELTYPERED